MVSVCLPSDALLQHLPSYLGFSYLGHGVSLHGCSSKVQPLLLTLDKGYLLTISPPDLERGIAPLGPPAPPQPPLLGHEVAPPGRLPWPQAWGSFSWPPPLGHGVLLASVPDRRCGVAPLCHAMCSGRSRPHYDCSHEIKRRLLLGRKVMTNLDSILKSRDITLPTKVRLAKAMVFPVVMYGCESWTVGKAEHRRIDAFELWCWRRLLRVP